MQPQILAAQAAARVALAASGRGRAVWLPLMGALVSREVLDAMADPRFLEEVPEELRDAIQLAVGQAGPGSYGVVKLGPMAGAVRDAARTLLHANKPLPAKLAGALPDLARIPGY